MVCDCVFLYMTSCIWLPSSQRQSINSQFHLRDSNYHLNSLYDTPVYSELTPLALTPARQLLLVIHALTAPETPLKIIPQQTNTYSYQALMGRISIMLYNIIQPLYTTVSPRLYFARSLLKVVPLPLFAWNCGHYIITFANQSHETKLHWVCCGEWVFCVYLDGYWFLQTMPGEISSTVDDERDGYCDISSLRNTKYYVTVFSCTV